MSVLINILMGTRFFKSRKMADHEEDSEKEPELVEKKGPTLQVWTFLD